MSLDIVAHGKLLETDYGTDVRDLIESMTLDSRISKYWETLEIFKENADSVLGYEGAGDKIYVFTRDGMEKIKEIAVEQELGEDVIYFLDYMLGSSLDRFYITLV